MKKYRTLTAVALLALPSMLISIPSHSTTVLPTIGDSAGQSCPLENQAGCFGSGSGFAGNSIFGVVAVNADRFRRDRLNTCLQFIRQIRNIGAAPG